MRHEGDTVAGESPGKSEQRNSPGETAPGERDPRLAVFRESSPEARPSAVATANRTEDSETRDTPPRSSSPDRTLTLTPGAAPRTAASSGGTAGGPSGGAASEDAGTTRTAEAAEDEGGDEGGEREPEGARDGKADGGDGKARRDGSSTPDKAASAADGVRTAAGGASASAKGSDGAGARAAATAVAPSRSGEDRGGDSSSADKDKDADKDGDKSPDKNADTDKAERKSEGASARPRPAWAKGDGGDGKDSGNGKDGRDGDGKDEEPVDHPTAVFRALPRERVDQPTTSLKLPREAKTGPSAKPAAGPTVEPSAKTNAGSAAERNAAPTARATAGPTATPTATPSSQPSAQPSGASSGAPSGEQAGEQASTFVPLRRSDVPSAPVEAERTRQQPMPPLPPLDLLAELTNTPPPPETPVRTAVRRVKIWTPLVLLLLVVFAVVQALRPLPAPELTLSGDPTYTFEGGKLDLPWPDEGQGGVEVEGVGTIGMYGEQKPAPIASVAKTMTAYVILRDHPITGDEVGPKITVDKQAGEESNRPDESTAPIEEGEQFTQKQMLQLLMIPSGNNAARLLARWDATSEEAFVEKMNAAAKDLGMTSTTYTDPSGLEASTVSTAADQLKLGKAVMRNDVFREIVNTPQIKIPGVEPMIYNNNRILLEPGVSGIKTGSSTPAGGNLLWTADTIIDGESRRIVGTVMGAQKGATLDDKLQLAITNSLEVIKAAQEGVTSAAVVKKGEVVGYVDDGLGGRTPVVATKDLKAVGWAGLEVKLDLGAGAGRRIPHAAEAGTVVGELTIGSGTGKVSAPVALQKDLAEPGFGAKLTRVG
ncbi:D-alanyl-D-alanine carboxypeptidase [Streptomyces sp. NBC_00872]|uniref:D-alanyl-D-alanine carboxypeptidase n=1 Tax=Streptomyces sp. NBC_00872 TaxID=2903686 RepID=UPI00386B9C61|nr:D-alanyl-D-alanine carboxypeptidase [Streptomyces sp. NBC_00872]